MLASGLVHQSPLLSKEQIRHVDFELKEHLASHIVLEKIDTYVYHWIMRPIIFLSTCPLPFLLI